MKRERIVAALLWASSSLPVLAWWLRRLAEPIGIDVAACNAACRSETEKGATIVYIAADGAESPDQELRKGQRQSGEPKKHPVTEPRF